MSQKRGVKMKTVYFQQEKTVHTMLPPHSPRSVTPPLTVTPIPHIVQCETLLERRWPTKAIHMK